MFERTQKIKRMSMARDLVTAIDMKSPISEQFRSIRTMLSFMMPASLKTIAVTSTIAGEGKSTTAANMGIVFAQEGKRVLLIDADLRKPTLHHTFKLENECGLADVLAQKNTYTEAVQDTFLVGLSVMTCGQVPLHPAELFTSSTFSAFLEEVKEHFDLVLFDAPPLLLVPDAQLLVNKCDATIFVVHAGLVKRGMALRAKALLKASQANTLGVVLNQYKTVNYEYY
ncbi:MAG: CpsD/CapB family tyrosine-protein kinase [Solibacillus sp.]